MKTSVRTGDGIVHACVRFDCGGQLDEIRRGRAYILTSALPFNRVLAAEDGSRTWTEELAQKHFMDLFFTKDRQGFAIRPRRLLLKRTLARLEIGIDGTTFAWVLEKFLWSFGISPEEALLKLPGPAKVVEQVAAKFTSDDADTSAIFQPEFQDATCQHVAGAMSILEIDQHKLLGLVRPLEDRVLDWPPPHRPDFPAWAK